VAKKEKALIIGDEIREKISVYRDILNKELGYYKKSINDEDVTIKVEDLHRKICKKSTTDKTKLAKATNTKNKKILYVLEPNKGAKIRNAIIQILNSFEYIAVGVKLGVFDRQVIKDLYITIFVKFYTVFSEYIVHYNDMYSENSNTIWINFRSLAIEFIAEFDDYKKEMEKLIDE